MLDVESEIRRDEVVVFYPTYARQVDEGRCWDVSIHGVIFEPEVDSLTRAAALGLMRRLFGLSREQTETALFKERAAAFLVDNEGGKEIAVRFDGGPAYPVATSGTDGHFATTLRLPAAQVERLRQADAHRRGWLAFRAVTRAGDDRTFPGQVQLVGPEGLSVISDIDDTIKISQVGNPRELMRNTFLREFAAVEGMAALYRAWADDGAAFHYLSASPWQLYGPLAEFLQREGFPPGSFHLKPFRLKDRSALALLGSQTEYKSRVIEQLLADFPRRRFILVGDSAEQDPELYAAAARNHPEQVARIVIRVVGGPGAEAVRFRTAFEGLASDLWQVFSDPSELEGPRSPRSDSR